MSSGLGESFDRAQRQYDNQMPPDDDSCEAECQDCEGMGIVKGDDCPTCKGTGLVENHSWRRVRSDGEVTLMRCSRCGAEEVD